jgi:HK97 family phage prohead protease
VANTIEGYAALFNTETVIAGLFREVIAAGAFEASLKRDDVRALFNHNADTVLGRKSARTLTLREDAKGLWYSVTLNPDDPAAASIAARIKRRDVSGSSFWFAVDRPEDEEWSPAPTRTGLPLRTLKKLRLIDVSAVTFPAYEPTSVIVRTDAEAIAVRELWRARLEVERARAWRAR